MFLFTLPFPPTSTIKTRLAPAQRSRRGASGSVAQTLRHAPIRSGFEKVRANDARKVMVEGKALVYLRRFRAASHLGVEAGFYATRSQGLQVGPAARRIAAQGARLAKN